MHRTPSPLSFSLGGPASALGRVFLLAWLMTGSNAVAAGALNGHQSLRHGRITIEDLPAAATDLVLTMERSEGDPYGPLFIPGAEPNFGAIPWTTVRQVPIAKDGTFSASLPQNASNVRFIARGRFALGIAAFEVGGNTDPGTEPLNLDVFVGGEVTLQLHFEGDVSEQERRSLVGRSLTVSGTQPFEDRLQAEWPAEYGLVSEFSRVAEIDEELKVVLPHLPTFGTRIIARDGDPQFTGNSGQAVFAPFYTSPALRWRAQAGRATQIDVLLRRGISFSGQVVDQQGQPVAAATVDTTSGAGTPALLDQSRSVTDADGRFHVEGLASAPEKVRVFAQGFLGTTLEGSLLPGPESKQELRISLDPGNTLDVRVTTEAGRPARGFPVILNDPGGGRFSVRRASTDRQGRATFRQLSGEPITISGYAIPSPPNDQPELETAVEPLRFRPSNNADYDIREGVKKQLWIVHAEAVQITDQPLSLELQCAPRIHGVVQGIDSKRGPTQVRVAPAGESPNAYGLPLSNFASLSLDGQSQAFEFQLPPGTYLIAAAQGKQSGQNLDLAQLRATPNVTLDTRKEFGLVKLDFDSHPARPMTGTACFANGDPVAGLNLYLSSRTSMHSSASIQVETDASGSFRTGPMPAGDYSLMAKNVDGSVQAWINRIVFDPSQAQPIDLVVEHAGWVQVQCDQDWQSIRMAGQTPIPYWSPIQGSAQGGVQAGPLRPGLYAFALEKTHPNGSVTMLGDQVRVEPGATTTIELGHSVTDLATIQGRLTAGGKPVPGMQVSAHLDGFDLAWSKTDLDGRYVLMVDGQGPMNLRFQVPHDHELARRSIVASRATDSVLDVKLPTGAIFLSTQSLGQPFGSYEWLRIRNLTPDADSSTERTRNLWTGSSLAFLYLDDGRYELAQINREQEVRARAEVELIHGAVLRNVKLEPVAK